MPKIRVVKDSNGQILVPYESILLEIYEFESRLDNPFLRTATQELIRQLNNKVENSL